MSGQFGFGSAGSSPPRGDFDVTFHDSVVTFAPLTPAARAWVEDHVQTEPWQWLGNAAFIVDHRFVRPLLSGILDAGMEVA